MKISEAKQASVTAERVRYLFNYEPSTGRLIRRVNAGYRARKGSIAGGMSRHGYRIVRVDGIVFMAHRIVWMHVHGEWPAKTLDHINGDRSDNRLENLRLADQYENGYNRKVSRRSSTGVLGVYWENTRLKFSASINFRGKTYNLGRYSYLKEAVAARKQAEQRLYGEFQSARGGAIE